MVPNKSLDSDEHEYLTEFIASFFVRSSGWLGLNKSKESPTYEKCDKMTIFAHKMIEFGINFHIKLLRFYSSRHFDSPLSMSSDLHEKQYLA